MSTPEPTASTMPTERYCDGEEDDIAYMDQGVGQGAKTRF